MPIEILPSAPDFQAALEQRFKEMWMAIQVADGNREVLEETIKVMAASMLELAARVSELEKALLKGDKKT